MTANRGRARVYDQSDILGVHSLDTFSFSVPDLGEASRFHTAFGLNVAERDEELELKTFGHDHVWGRISEGRSKALQYMSFAAFEQDMPRFRERLRSRGVTIVDPPVGLETNGLWFRDFEGTLVEIKVAPKSSPDTKSHGQLISSPEGVAGAPPRSAAGSTVPSRMSHLLLFTSDVAKAVEFYTDILGLGLSDRSGNSIAFLHGRHGSDHHMIAFVRSSGPGIHHTSWDVPSIHKVGLGAMQMAESGFADGWGLGRHVLGSNYFHYVRDPWGSYAEYSCDMDFIPGNLEWESGDHDSEDAFYVWGPTPPEDFAVNHELKDG